MSKRASSPAALALSIALGGAALSGGCALVYDFDKYTGASASSGSVSGAGGGSTSVSAGPGGTGGGGSDGRGPSPVWVRQLGGASADFSGHPGVAVAQNLNVYAAGIFQGKVDLGLGSMMLSSPTVLISKLDAMTGTTQWTQNIATTTGEPPVVAPTSDGVVIAGSFNITANLTNPQVPVATMGGFDAFVIKLDPQSSILWGSSFAGLGDQVVRAVAVAPSGLVYIAGEFTGELKSGMLCTGIAGNAAGDGFVALFDASGVCQWVKPWTSPSSMKGEAALSLVAVADGVYVAGTYTGVTALAPGFTLSGGIANEVFIAKINAADGAVTSATPIANAQEASLALNPLTLAPTFAANVAGEVILGGFTAGAITKGGTFGSMDVDRARAISGLPGSNLFVTGSTRGSLNFGKPLPYHGEEDLFLVMLSPSFMPITAFEVGDAEAQVGQGVTIDGAGNVYLSGDFKGALPLGGSAFTSAGASDMFVAKYGATAFP